MDDSDDELGLLFREGLRRRADGVEHSAAFRWAQDARTGLRQRRTVRSAVAGSVLVVAGIVVAGLLGPRLSAPDATPAVSRPPVEAPAGAVDPGFRREYFGGLQIDVPAGWGFGETPDGRLQSCTATVSLRGYVGRPFTLSAGLCEASPDSDGIPASYVWLGSTYPLGIQHLAQGSTRETAVLAGVRVSVGGVAPALRDRILDSARPQTLCPVTEPVLSPAYGGPFDVPHPFRPTSPALRMTVCAYRGAPGSSVRGLVYAEHRGPAAADTLVSQLARNQDAPERCGSQRDAVTVTVHYAAGSRYVPQRQVFFLGRRCGGIVTGYRLGRLRLSPTSLDAVADHGLRQVLGWFSGGG